MNIQEAKDSIKDAVSAYLAKDGAGNYTIPRNRQRPIMLVGAPGLGKTAIMSQIAAEMGIGYVGYTITHHTRQSAIGLPVIDTAVYDGVEHRITRYTMSEIVASVYDAIETQGRREGILFIDEVNCVSETLAPAMLDLLQNKKFGPHRIPEGWVLVAAGNPVEFNSSAREFDIATMDRIRTVYVEPDTDIWLRYAMSAGVHEAVTYYLSVKPQNLLRVERGVDGSLFVTPRGWEDLSTVLREYDGLGFDADLNLISQYIHEPTVASEFKRYLDFHRRYRSENDVDAILEGRSETSYGGDAEERLALSSVVIGRLNSEAEEGMDLRDLLEALDSGESLFDIRGRMRREMDGNVTADRRRSLSRALSAMADRSDADALREETRSRLEDSMRRFDSHVANAVEHMRRCYGEGQELTTLMSGLIGCRNVVMFAEPTGSLYTYTERILVHGRGSDIRRRMGVSE